MFTPRDDLRNGFANGLLGTLVVAATFIMTNVVATTVAVSCLLGYLLVGARRLASPHWLLGAALAPLLLFAVLAAGAIAFCFTPLFSTH